MHALPAFRRVARVAVVALLVGCTATPLPTPTALPTSAPPSTPSPMPTPSPTPSPPPTFPLAVVTGISNLKSTISVDELGTLAAEGRLVVPCGVDVNLVPPAATPPCLGATAIAGALVADRDMVALLPPGLVEPATKVLRIAGDGPYGLFGPDLFGDPEARALPYPVIGTPSEGNPEAFELAWAAYDPSEVWTMTSIGSLCAGPIAAYWAVTRGRGWDWVFNGGTARYDRVYRNPTPPGTVGYGFLIVDAVDTGNEGVTPSILKRSDVAHADHECPVQPTETWRPPTAIPPSLAIPEDNLTRWRDLMGLDAVYLAANHMSDRGVAGIQSTLQLLGEYGFPGTGLGMNLDQALEPAYLSVAGLRIGFVAWNNVGGVARADGDTAGVAWLTEANVTEAVRRARAGGADLVICDPQWWGGAEYHSDLRGSQFTEIGWFDNAGCDHVIGAGTHVAGPLLIRTSAGGASLVLGSPGNYVFGQPWWQEVQEGVILEMSFRGTELVNARFHPYVILDSVRPALIDPVTDGRYVLERIWSGASLDLD